MIPIGPVVSRITVPQPRETVWHFVADPDRRADWYAALEFGLNRGDIAAAEEQRGTVDVLVRGHVFGFRWAKPEQLTTHVMFTLRTVTEGTLITVTETGFDALPDGAAASEKAQQAWDQALSKLAAADYENVEVPEQYLRYAFAAEAAVGNTEATDSEAASETQLADQVAAEVAEADDGSETNELADASDENGGKTEELAFTVGTAEELDAASADAVADPADTDVDHAETTTDPADTVLDAAVVVDSPADSSEDLANIGEEAALETAESVEAVDAGEPVEVIPEPAVADTAILDSAATDSATDFAPENSAVETAIADAAVADAAADSLDTEETDAAPQPKPVTAHTAEADAFSELFGDAFAEEQVEESQEESVTEKFAKTLQQEAAGRSKTLPKRKWWQL